MSERVIGPRDGGAIAAPSEDWRRAVEEHGIANAVLIARNDDTRAAAHIAAREQLRTQRQLGDDVDCVGPDVGSVCRQASVQGAARRGGGAVSGL